MIYKMEDCLNCNASCQAKEILTKVYFNLDKKLDYKEKKETLLDIPGVEHVELKEETMIVLFDDRLIAPEKIAGFIKE